MNRTPPFRPRPVFSLALPPSLGHRAAEDRAGRLEGFLSRALGKPVEVPVAQSYDALTKGLLSGAYDAAWAPPFVCARVEALGAKVAVRGIRRGAASYRAALLARAAERLSLEQLQGKVALWAERDSVGGHLLAVAFLKAAGIDPAKTFKRQEFAGSYRAALEGVLEARADVTSVFAPAAKPGLADETGLEQVLPGASAKFSVLAFTEESPNDGVAVSLSLGAPTAVALERSLVELDQSEEGRALLTDIFAVERFEPAPKMSYRALYRVALASI